MGSYELGRGVVKEKEEGGVEEGEYRLMEIRILGERYRRQRRRDTGGPGQR